MYNISGAVTGRKNNIANNLNWGLYNYFGRPTRNFTLGRFVGNARYGLYNVGSTTFVAQSNWWGRPDGPRCTSGRVAGTTGDSISGTVNFSPPLGADPVGSVPPLSPMLLRLRRAASDYSAP